ncbi:MAG: hypothetical protein AAF750_10940 [Planctomycetota bacterium]
MRLLIRSLVVSFTAFFALPALPQPAPGNDEQPVRRKISDNPDGPRKIELDDAGYYLKQFEDYAKSLKGEKGEFTRGSRIALQKVSDLRKKYPGDPQVEALFSRARTAARLLQGVTLEIKPEMLAYRGQAVKNAERLGEVSVAAWESFRAEVAAQEGAILKPLPAPSPEEVLMDELVGKPVILDGVRYPDDLFPYYSRQFIAIGKPSTGFYFVDVSARPFIGAYEAVRRYERRISNDIPAEWTVVGEIVGAQAMVPEPGEVKVGAAYTGWIVKPRAIYVPGKVFAFADDEHEEGGRFAGEDRLAEIFADQYTVKAVAPDASPADLIDTFVTALKERNYDLYFDCIDPLERRTPIQTEWLERKYDIFQRRLSEDYVHIAVYKADPVRVIQGGEDADDEALLAEFLDASDVAREAKHALPRVEEQVLWLHLYDETGKVREAPKGVTVRRQADVANNRWFIYRGFPF